MFIEIEGIDGAGKTTQCDLLLDFYRHRNIEAIAVREPAGTEFGSRIKDLIMSDVPRGDKAEMFSFLAAKAQLYSQMIVPALAAGKRVISDRGGMSFLSYHCISTGLEIEALRSIMEVAAGPTTQPITIVLDLPPETAMARIRARGKMSPFDKRSREFFELQRDLFKRLCDSATNCAIIDGSLSTEEVFTQVRNSLSAFEGA